GLGNSEGVHCLAERPTLEHPFPRTREELATFIAAARSIDEACQKNSGWLLPHLGIENAARDLDRIRIALGEEKITLAGNNWAATLDAVYADLFPSHLRAAVLGGPFKPGIDDEVLLTGQAETSQAALDMFLADCAADDACPFHSGGATRQAFDTVMARFAKGPIGGLTEREASTMVYFGLMGTTSDLAKALGAAAKGDVSVLNDMYGWSGVSDPVASDQYDAYNCLDYAWGRSPDAYAALADRLASVSPDFGRMLAFGDFGCAYWPAPPLRPSTTLTAAGAPPILLVAARRDPQTPYAWSAELAKQLSSGVLLTVDSDAVSTVDSNSECARQAVDHYLLTLEPPPAGTTCR
ncbi:MAG: alpha/beta hydrolase, partial [Candidatus Limnocylindrales bacterium]